MTRNSGWCWQCTIVRLQVCVLRVTCADWTHPHTCWLDVKGTETEMSLVTVTDILPLSSHVKSWLWWWSWGKKGKQARPPPTSLQWWWCCWDVMSDVAEGKDWETLTTAGRISRGKKKKRSVTQKSHLTLTGLISLATISTRLNSNQLKLSLSLCFYLSH